MNSPFYLNYLEMWVEVEPQKGRKGKMVRVIQSCKFSKVPHRLTNQEQCFRYVNLSFWVYLKSHSIL
jgi:hypothetical protein